MAANNNNVDECANPRACPEYAICSNSFGSYSCFCKSGFESSSGNLTLQGFGEKCEDVDECSRNSTVCGSSSNCANLPGSYICYCLPGFYEEYNLDLDVFQCTDIDECTDMCGFNSTCTNTPGSFFCTCQPGFAPRNGEQSFTEQEVECIDIDECFQDPSPCGPNSVCTNALGSYSCSCMAGFRPNPEGSWKDGNFSCKRIPFKCKEDVIPNNERVQQCQGTAAMEPESASFCALMDTTFSALDDACKNKTTTVSLERMVESFTAVLEQRTVWSNFTKEEKAVLATVVLESVERTALAAFLKPSQNGSQTVQTEALDTESKVIKEECIEEKVVFHLKAKGDEMRIGCSTIEESESTGTTGVAFVSFAGMESVLDESYFQDLQDSLANSKRKLKMNSRIVGGIMTGEKKDGFSEPIMYTLENIQTGCAIIAGILHYLFLACFFWMLVEAVMLFLMVRNLKVVNYFSSRNIKMLHLCAFGYGLPALVVVISASAQPQGYGMHNRCWLNTETGFIWSFLGPVCTVILINTVLLTWTLWILRQKLSSVNAEISTLKDTRLLTFKAFAQLFILGCSWVLGIFQIGPIASFMAYLFTVINSLQGVFIFLIHCLLSRQVREEYRRWITRKTKPSSESQTSGILLSSNPSTSKMLCVDMQDLASPGTFWKIHTADGWRCLPMISYRLSCTRVSVPGDSGEAVRVCTEKRHQRLCVHPTTAAS